MDLVLSGHSHIYQRGERNGIKYVICGGGGGELEREDDRVENYNIFEVTQPVHHFLRVVFDSGSSELRVSATSLDTEERELDSFTLKSRKVSS